MKMAKLKCRFKLFGDPEWKASRPKYGSNVCFIYQRLTFVSFINVFTRIRMVNCQGFYAISFRSFYVKLGLFIELYLTLQTDFAAR